MQIKEQAIFQTNDKKSDNVTAIKTADGFRNLAARLGVSNRGPDGCEDNLLSAAHYEFNLLTRNRLQLEAAYRGSWIVGQVIDTFAEDMTRAGIDIQTNEGAKYIPELKVLMSRTKIWQSIASTIKWANLFGGAIAVLQIKGQRLDTPIDLDTVGKDQFLGLVVYDRWQLAPSLDDLIQEGPEMGLPKYYAITLGSNLNDPSKIAGVQEEHQTNGQVRVHHSRCIRMIGIELPFFQAITEMLWGESKIERMWDRLLAFDEASLASGQLIDKAQLRVVQIEDLRSILAAGGEAEAGLLAQFEHMRKIQSNEGLTILDGTDKFSTTAYSFAGLSDVLLFKAQEVSGSAEIPVVRLFKQTPGGLNSSGDADLRNYYDSCNAKQNSQLRNPIEILLKVMWRSLTGQPAPKDLSFEFSPLWQMSDVDKANIGKITTDTIIEAHQEGGIDTATMKKELKHASHETGLFTHITDEEITEAENEEPPLPAKESSEKEIPGQAAGQEGAEPSQPKKTVKKAGDGTWDKIKKFLTRDRGVEATMKEFEAGTLKSSSGKKVTAKKQALAIGYSEDQKKIRGYLGIK